MIKKIFTKKVAIIISLCTVCCSCVFFSIKYNLVKAENTNNKPYIQKLPSDFKNTTQATVKPTDTKKFNGNIDEVKNFASYVLTTYPKLPDDVKSKYVNTTPGTPLFIKDERDPSIDIIHDSYIVPLYKGNKIVGQCTVAIWDGELAFSAISDVDATSDSFFNRDYNKILDKVKREKGIQVKDYELVLKPDYKSQTGLSVYDPRGKITAMDERVFYYSNDNLIQDKSELDKNSSPNSCNSKLGN